METVAEHDEPKLNSANLLAIARVRDSTLTLRCVTLADFMRKRRRSRGKWLGGRDSKPERRVSLSSCRRACCGHKSFGFSEFRPPICPRESPRILANHPYSWRHCGDAGRCQEPGHRTVGTDRTTLYLLVSKLSLCATPAGQRL